jgi:cell wall-associated NlpC family hydrolase
MNALRKMLEAVAEKLQSNEALLHKAQRRHKKFRERTEAEHRRQVAAQKAGETAKADRCAHRALKSHQRAVYWKGKVRQQSARISHLEKSEAELEAAIQKWKREHGIVFEGHNKVRGGQPDQRLRAAIHRAALNYRKGTQPGYYSQEGAARAYDHGLYHYPYGHIWDCSTFADAMYFVCGLDSPSGPSGYTAGGYTGTEMAHGKVVPESKARSGDLVIFQRYPGDTIAHHVEVVDDPTARTTIGHGDSAIDSAGGGSIGFDLFGDGLYVIRTYH